MELKQRNDIINHLYECNCLLKAIHESSDLENVCKIKRANYPEISEVDIYHVNKSINLLPIKDKLNDLYAQYLLFFKEKITHDKNKEKKEPNINNINNIKTLSSLLTFLEMEDERR